jgi:hypothetical protein
MDGIDSNYDEWCRRIAESKDTSDLIDHFRKHVCEHYERHNRQGETSLKVWVIGALNFMHILEKKFPYVEKEDMLFKLCTYHKNHQDGPDAPFDTDKFMEEYDGDIKKLHKR